LDKVKDLTKEVFLSLLHVLYLDCFNIFRRKSLRSKLTYETLLEVTNKLDLSYNEKEETEELLRKIKIDTSWN
jgi:hypothetical protein